MHQTWNLHQLLTILPGEVYPPIPADPVLQMSEVWTPCHDMQKPPRPNAVNITPPLNAIVKLTNAQAAKESIQPGIMSAPTESVQFKMEPTTKVKGPPSLMKY